MKTAPPQPTSPVRFFTVVLVMAIAWYALWRSEGRIRPSADTYNQSAAQTAAVAEDQMHLLSFSELKTAPYATGSIPPEMAALDGQMVGIVGYLLPFDIGNEVRHFLLVENTFGCCYGQPPLPWHVIEVTLPESMPSLAYDLAPLKVEGIFQAREVFEGNDLLSVYEITPTRAEYLRPEAP